MICKQWNVKTLISSQDSSRESVQCTIKMRLTLVALVWVVLLLILHKRCPISIGSISKKVLKPTRNQPSTFGVLIRLWLFKTSSNSNLIRFCSLLVINKPNSTSNCHFLSTHFQIIFLIVDYLGTLDPMNSWDTELRIPFAVKLATAHVIDSKLSVLASIVNASRTGVSLNFSYSNR